MVELFYTLINICITPILLLNLVYRCSIGKEDVDRVAERLGYSNSARPDGKLVWVHAASVGEAMSIVKLIDFLHSKNYKIVFTTFTLNAAKAAKKKYGSKIIHQFIPLENYFAIKLFLKKWRPNLAIFVESEFWPVILYQTSKVTRVISVNTRVSDQSFINWQRFNFFIKSFLKKVDKFYPQSVEDAARLKKLGFYNVKYYGNFKYSVGALQSEQASLQELKTQIGKRKIFLAFSTHDTEEELFLGLYKKLQKKHPGLLLIIVPRHPERSNEIEDLIKQHDLRYALRSKRQPINNKTEIYLADTIGELGTLFTLAKINIVGGSFNKEIGGHNPIEPALMNSMCIMGPQHYNFVEITRDFDEAKGIILVDDINQAEKQLNILLSNPKLVRKYADNASKLVKKKSQTIDQLLTDIGSVL